MFDSDPTLPGSTVLNVRAFGHRLQELDAQLRHVEAQIAATITAAKHAGAYCEDGHSTIAGWGRAQNKVVHGGDSSAHPQRTTCRT